MLSKRWFQFSLRTLLVGMILCAVWLGWTMNYLRSLEPQWEALERIRLAHSPNLASISYEAESATVLGSALPGRFNPKWKLVRSLRAHDEDGARVAAKEIPHLPHLVRLDLGSRALTDYDLRTLSTLAELRELSISSDYVTGKFLAEGMLRTTIESLTIRSIDFDNAGVGHIGQCTHLRTLVLRDEHNEVIRQGVTDWKFLSSLTELRDLSLEAPVTDEAMRAVAVMPELRSFAISSSQLTERGVIEIAKSKSIETLVLHVLPSGGKPTSWRRPPRVRRGGDPGLGNQTPLAS